MASGIFGRKVASGILVAFGSLTMILAFQNCAQSGFQSISVNGNVRGLASSSADTSSNPTNSDPANNSNSNSDSSSGTNTSSSSGTGSSGSASSGSGTNTSGTNTSGTNTSGTSSGGGATGSTSPSSTPTASTPVPVATPTPSVPNSGYQPSQLYNFVAATKVDCDNSIQSRFAGSRMDCRLGGGCGVSCGAPGGSCESANPNAYGACINPDGARAQPMQAGSATGLINVVNANGLAACNSTLQQNYPGSTATCKLGGGCGVSCGAPGPFCLSANPNSYGACIGADKNKAAPTGVCSLSKTDAESCNRPSYPASQLFNFVATTKTDCDAAIQGRFPGAGVDCRIGAGCGVSCGAPGGNCDSANPSAWGACVNPDGTRAYPTTSPAYPASSLYNIVVGGTLETCNATVKASRPGFTGSCSMGGGCGANSCGAPGPFCTASLSYYYGVCLNPDNSVAKPTGIPLN